METIRREAYIHMALANQGQIIDSGLSAKQDTAGRWGACRAWRDKSEGQQVHCLKFIDRRRFATEREALRWAGENV
jgi:hypothetical protein